MYIKFIKEHIAGLKVDQTAKVNTSFGQEMIKEGYAVEATEAEHEAFKSSRGFAPTKKKRGRPAKAEAPKEEKKAEKKAKKSKK